AVGRAAKDACRGVEMTSQGSAVRGARRSSLGEGDVAAITGPGAIFRSGHLAITLTWARYHLRRYRRAACEGRCRGRIMMIVSGLRTRGRRRHAGRAENESPSFKTVTGGDA